MIITKIENSETYKKLLESTRRYHLGGIKSGIYFTSREAQCVAAMLEGYSQKEAARYLGLSESTLRNYMENIRHKLGCDSVSGVIKIAKQSGFHLLRDNFRKTYFSQ